MPLEIVHSPYRDLVAPVESFLDDLDARWSNDTITIVIPEFVVGTRSLANLLHGQSALALKLALIDRPNTVVTSVPFHPTLPVAGAPRPPETERSPEMKRADPPPPVDAPNGETPLVVTPPRDGDPPNRATTKT